LGFDAPGAPCLVSDLALDGRFYRTREEIEEGTMSTLLVVEEVLRERGIPMVVREIVQVAAERLPTRSKTPDTVVARDLAMDIKKHGPESRFTRVAPGRYTLRELVQDIEVCAEGSPSPVLDGPLPPMADEVMPEAPLGS
jgi:hypothetical protein